MPLKYTVIHLAGMDIGVQHLYDSVNRFPAMYRSDAQDVDFSVTITPEDLDLEQEKHIAECQLEQLPVVRYSPTTLESTAVQRKIAQQLPARQAVVFHGAAVAIGERAVLFTAKSGTGKTTHARLWLKNIPGSYIVNGDKPVLQAKADGIRVCGSPWAGKEGYGCAACVPLEAICILRRAETNSIEALSFSEAFPVLFAQTYRPPQREALTDSLKVLNAIGSAVKFYRLSCNMDDEAAFVAYERMLQ